MMSTQLINILGPVGGILIGLALILVVFLLGRDYAAASPAPPSRATLRVGWFLVGVAGVAVLIISVLRLVAAV